MKKVVFFFNSPYLGGAERSFCHQIAMIKEDSDYEIIIPFLNNQKKETESLNELLSLLHINFDKVKYFQFDKGIFQFSRSAPLRGLVGLFFGLINTLKSLQKLNLTNKDIWWANGNKIGFVLYIWAFISGFSQSFLWHFRDYPTNSGLFKYIWKVFTFLKPFRLLVVGNSYDVSLKAKELLPRSSQAFTVYNPIGEKLAPSIKNSKGNYVLGVVAMFAPWKGINTVITMASLYEKELREIGVQEIHIYGGEIYQTKGAHTGYAQHLQTLNQKFSNSLIQFKGLMKPEEIFKDIDLLIHSSLREEPFGRVIVEAFSSQIPVVSTSLGGAAELIDKNKRGFSYLKYDYHGMVEAINKALNHENSTNVILNAYEFSQDLAPQVRGQMLTILKEA